MFNTSASLYLKYPHISFSYSSSDFDSDSDSDYSEESKMSNLTKAVDTCASKIHHAFVDFFKSHAVDGLYFETNQNIVKTVFACDAALWTEYERARAEFKNEGTLEERAKLASVIGDAAVAIRKSSTLTASSVITANLPIVKIDGLTADEINNIKTLHTLLIAKMSANGKGSAKQGDTDQMLKDFKNDLSLISKTKCLSPSWFEKFRIWKVEQIAISKKSPIDWPTDSDDPIVAALIKRINEAKEIAPPNQDGEMANVANKFAVDSIICTINHYKTKVKSGKVEDFLSLMESIAAFTRSIKVGKIAWLKFVSNFPVEAAFFNDITTGNVLYDNPGKLTKQRLISCAACLFESAEPTAMFGNTNTTVKIPQMISKVYAIEVKYNVISKEPDTTSTCEHLLHLLLALGSNYSYAFNRNHIPNSVRNVKFEVSGN